MYKQMVIASGSDNNVSLRHSPRHFPEENIIVCIYVVAMPWGRFAGKPWNRAQTIILKRMSGFELLGKKIDLNRQEREGLGKKCRHSFFHTVWLHSSSAVFLVFPTRLDLYLGPRTAEVHLCYFVRVVC